MERKVGIVLYVLALVTVVVGVDVLLLQHVFWERLLANIGIVLLFAACYVRFLKPGSTGLE
jgi:hypothetical protein